MEPPTLNLEEPGSIQSLVRLRARVESAAREIERLREENQSLSARLSTIESFSTTALGDQGDPDVLRARLDRFIEAVDRAIESADGNPTQDAT